MMQSTISPNKDHRWYCELKVRPHNSHLIQASMNFYRILNSLRIYHLFFHIQAQLHFYPNICYGIPTTTELERRQDLMTFGKKPNK